MNEQEHRLNDGRFVEQRQYDIKQLWERHHEMLRLLVAGYNNLEVAEAIGVTPQTVSNVRNSPLGREKLERLRSGRDESAMDITERVQEFAPIALQVLEDIIAGSLPATTQLRARTAENYMSRAGYGPVHKVHALHATVKREDIDRIKERARQAAYAAGVVVSVEPNNAPADE